MTVFIVPIIYPLVIIPLVLSSIMDKEVKNGKAQYFNMIQIIEDNSNS
jgi:hypothetical protein